MKVRAFFVLSMALSIAALTSCKKESYTGIRATANFEAPSYEDDGEKLYYNGSQFQWKNTDKIGMWDHSLNYQEYTAGATSDAEGNAIAANYSSTLNLTLANPQPSNASSSLDEEGPYYSFYPSYLVERTQQAASDAADDAADDAPDPTFTVKLPNQQILDNAANDETHLATLQLTRFPMVSKTATNYFRYKSLCGILRIHLAKRVGYISSVKFESLEGKQLRGFFNVTWDDSNDPILNEGESGNPAKCIAEVFHDNPVNLNIDGGRDFYIYLPANTYTGFKITFTDDQGRTCVKTYKTTTITVNRNVIKPLSFGSKVNFNFVQKNGIFTTGMNCDGTSLHRVHFSLGNLQYVNTNWQFASQQYETLTADANSNYDPDEVGSAGREWDLFRWSTIHDHNMYGRSKRSNDYNCTSQSDYHEFGLAFGNTTWRTLSAQEWFVLLYGRNTTFVIDGQMVRFMPLTIGSKTTTRPDPSNPWYTITNVDYTAGVLLIPDNFTNEKWNSYGLGNPPVVNTLCQDSKVPDQHGDYTESLICTKEKFAMMEQDGLIFLPFTYGKWNGTNHHAKYWTSTFYDQALHFDGGNHSQGTNNAASVVLFQSTSYLPYNEQVLPDCDNTFSYNSRAYVQNGQATTGYYAVRLVRDAE